MCELSILLCAVGTLGLGYPLFGFPVLLRVFAAFLPLPTPRLDKSFVPRVSVIVTCAGEFSCVEARILDLQAQAYPDLEIVLVFDGVCPSEELAQRLARMSPAPVVLCLSNPRGKTEAQNAAVSRARGEILVFTDIGSRFAPGALTELVAPLADSRVVATCGELLYSTPGMEARYWSFERTLKRGESQFSGTLGANGAIYALRHDQYVDLPAHGLADLVEPLLIGLFHGGRTVYVPGATAQEPLPASPDAVLSMKRRITLRALSALPMLMPCLDFARRPRLAFVFASHKLLRWFSWVFGGVLLLGLLTGTGVTRGIALALALSAGCGWISPGACLTDAALYSTTLMYAQAQAFVRFSRGHRVACWRPTHLPDR